MQLSEFSPNFLVVGAAKSGTTALFENLIQHPDLFIPDRKECRFFSKMCGNFSGKGASFQNDIIDRWEDYLELFRGKEKFKSRGDISNDYLFYYEKSIAGIQKYLGKDLPIFIILRNPIERAYSNYLHHRREGWEDLSFREALDEENSRIKKNWAWPFFYKEVGLYSKQVEAYIAAFKNVHIFLYEDLRNMDSLLEKIFLALGLPGNTFSIEDKRYNVSGMPRWEWLQKNKNSSNPLKVVYRTFLPFMVRRYLYEKIYSLNLKKVDMSQSDFEYLLNYYKEDINILSSLLDRDLSHWLI